MKPLKVKLKTEEGETEGIIESVSPIKETCYGQKYHTITVEIAIKEEYISLILKREKNEIHKKLLDRKV